MLPAASPPRALSHAPRLVLPAPAHRARGHGSGDRLAGSLREAPPGPDRVGGAAHQGTQGRFARDLSPPALQRTAGEPSGRVRKRGPSRLPHRGRPGPPAPGPRGRLRREPGRPPAPDSRSPRHTPARIRTVDSTGEVTAGIQPGPLPDGPRRPGPLPPPGPGRDGTVPGRYPAGLYGPGAHTPGATGTATAAMTAPQHRSVAQARGMVRSKGSGSLCATEDTQDTVTVPAAA